ncbi:protein kinase domain-containing protein [Lentzea sp. NPDC004789]
MVQRRSYGSMLAGGERLVGESGDVVTVGEVLGIGGQGEVYLGHTDDGHAVAIKWYYAHLQGEAMRSQIADMVRWRAPSDHFLWPSDVLHRDDGQFGYWMPLRPRDYVSLSDVLRRKTPIAFRELLRVARSLVAAFDALHRRGYFWSDVSDNNVYVNPSTGHVLLGDHDNLGSAHRVPRVLGTPRFMAPEIVRGQTRPSTISSGYSMAILLFLLLMNDHPLQGEVESRIHVLDGRAMRKLYGTEPIFIFDPDDARNRPVPGVHVNAPIFWPLYPPRIREIFTRVFTTGLHDPASRPSCAEWDAALSSADGAIVKCHHCNREGFHWQENGVSPSCWGCAEPLQEQRKLVVNGGRVVLLAFGAEVHEGGLSAEVIRHPTLGFLGLRNMGGSPWTAVLPGAVVRTVAPGQSVRLMPGVRIDFGAASATVEI